MTLAQSVVVHSQTVLPEGAVLTRDILSLLKALGVTEVNVLDRSMPQGSISMDQFQSAVDQVESRFMEFDENNEVLQELKKVLVTRLLEQQKKPKSQETAGCR